MVERPAPRLLVRSLQKRPRQRVPEEGMLQQLGGGPAVPLLLPQTPSQKILQAGGQRGAAASSQSRQLVLHTLTGDQGGEDQTQAENIGFLAAPPYGGRVGVF